MRTIGLFVVLVVGWMLGVVASDAEARTLRIAVEGKNPPFNQLDSKGRPYGFDVDIAKALCERMGAECTFVVQPWDRMIPGLLDGTHDAVVSSMSITQDRLDQVAFTNPYYSNQLRYIAREGAFIDPRQVPGLSIGAQRGTIAARHLLDNMTGVVKVQLYDTNAAALEDLVAGRINGVLADELFAFNWISTPEGQGFTLAGNAIDVGDQIGIAVRKEDTALRESFNTALASILADGTFAAINDKYFPFNIY